MVRIPQYNDPIDNDDWSISQHKHAQLHQNSVKGTINVIIGHTIDRDIFASKIFRL